MNVYAERADKALIHYETVANSDSWKGDREPYLVRQLAYAQACATLAVAERLRDLVEAQS